MARPVEAPPSAAAPASEGPHDVSLLLGGPFFQLLLRAGLIRPDFNLLVRRILVLALLAWLPLAVLTWVAGTALRGSVDVPFLLDIEVHARFLVAVPLLVLAERVIHLRLRPAIGRFVERGLVDPEHVEAFDAILAGARHWRGSYVAEAAMIVASFALTPLLWVPNIALEVPTWYATPTPTGPDLTAAGFWLAYAAIPLQRFLIWRWLYRLMLLYVALARISRLPLRVLPTHPDRAGGLSFLGELGYALQPFNAAIAALVSGFVANQLIFEGQALPDYYALIGSVLAVLLLLTLVPMLFFDPLLTRARRRGLAEYGALAQAYVRGFHDKWVEGKAPPPDPLLGSADIQSLADLASGFDIVREMRTIPMGLKQMVQLVIASALPFAPLLLAVMPLDTLLKKLLDVVF